MNPYASPRARRFALVFGAAVALAACSETPTASEDPVPTTVDLSRTSVAFVALGDTLRLVATVRDQNGAAMEDVPVSWTSSSTAVVTVSTTGLLTSVADGDAVVTAAAAAPGVDGASAIEVRQTADHVRFEPEVVFLEAPDDTVTVLAAVVDANLNPMSGQSVSWSADDGDVLEVDADGLVTARADGATRILATVGTVVAELSAFVGQQRVVIESVAPGVLLEDSIATIHGLGFSQEPGANEVTLDGAEAEVTFASSTLLRFRVPDAGCLPARTGIVRVEAFALSDSAEADVRPLAHDLLVGEGVWSDGGCLHMAPGTTAGERYMVGILSASEVVSSLTPAVLSAETGPAGLLAGPVLAPRPDRRPLDGAAGARVPQALPWGVLPGGGGWFRAPGETPAPTQADRSAAPAATARAVAEAFAPARVEARGRARQAEARIRSAELRLADALRSRPTRPGRGAMRPSGAPLAVVPSTGDTITYNVHSFDDGAVCTGATEVDAVVHYVGDAAVFVHDVGNPTSGFSASEYGELDDFLAGTTLPVITGHFGAITDLDDNDERIVVLITKEVNKNENLLGFVFGGDLVAPAQCTDSNQAEIFYGIAPDPNGVYGDARSKTSVLASYPTLIAHELTHIAQFANLRGPKTAWELEGGATLAEQLVGFEVFDGHGPRMDLGAAEWVASLDEGGWYGDWVFDMGLYFGYKSETERADGAPEECSWVEREDADNDGPCENGRAVYGVPSTLLRFVLDQHGLSHPGGDAGMMRALTSSNARGLQALEQTTGEEAKSILTRFGVTLWADGRVGDWLPSWNIADVFDNAGLPLTARLEPYLSTAAEPSLAVEVRASSNAYLEWRPPLSHEPTSLRIRTAGGDPLPEHMVLWILRIR